MKETVKQSPWHAITAKICDTEEKHLVDMPDRRHLLRSGDLLGEDDVPAAWLLRTCRSREWERLLVPPRDGECEWLRVPPRFLLFESMTSFLSASASEPFGCASE